MLKRPTLSPSPASRLAPAIALRKCLREGYGLAELRRDALAGVVVGVVALPLSMALAIAVGVAPQHGLYTAIVAGAVIALLGGSRVQISGPTAAFVVILAPIVTQFGLGGLLLATMMAGLILVLFAVVGLGRLIEFVPYPVTTGFTAGIGVVIATLQLKDFLGLRPAEMPESYLGKVAALGRALPTLHWPEMAVGVLTLVLLLVWPRFQRSIPAPLVALAVAAVAAWVIERWLPGVEIATIERRFSYVWGGMSHPGIPPLPPLPGWPWAFPGSDGQPLGLSFGIVRALLPSAFVIAVLGAIESLLSAVVADGMIRRQHDPDGELLAQGLGNLVAPFFGGIAATGAIARTATNVRHGGRSPVAAVVHSGFLLLATLVLAPWLGKLPMAALAALLLVVAWNMAEARLVVRTVLTAPRSDALVLLTCLSLTVLFDMVVAVVVG
ncbi:MAG: C4-dicarboxylic acid transporter DauA, partial [Acidobacteria bacterium]|nr:C4-dicarboxylic acid transporter DauA [Acidobacteriota bacterium]